MHTSLPFPPLFLNDVLNLCRPSVDVQRCNDDMPIRAIIGGFHLLNATLRRLEQTIMVLRDFSPDRIVPCRCTGEMAVNALREAFGDRVQPGSVGTRYCF